MTNTSRFEWRLLGEVLLRQWSAVLVYLTFLAIVFFSIAPNLQKTKDATWETTTGVVTRVHPENFEASVAAGTDGAGFAYGTCWVVEKKYAISEIQYESKRYSPKTSRGRCGYTTKPFPISELPKVGDTIKIWYDKNRPNYAVEVVDHSMLGFYTALIVTVTFFSMIIFVYLFKQFQLLTRRDKDVSN
jgi:hypothetical protein